MDLFLVFNGPTKWKAQHWPHSACLGLGLGLVLYQLARSRVPSSDSSAFCLPVITRRRPPAQLRSRPRVLGGDGESATWTTLPAFHWTSCREVDAAASFLLSPDHVAFLLRAGANLLRVSGRPRPRPRARAAGLRSCSSAWRPVCQRPASLRPARCPLLAFSA